MQNGGLSFRLEGAYIRNSVLLRLMVFCLSVKLVRANFEIEERDPHATR